MIFCVTAFFTLSQIFDTVVLMAFRILVIVFLMPFQTENVKMVDVNQSPIRYLSE